MKLFTVRVHNMTSDEIAYYGPVPEQFMGTMLEEYRNFYKERSEQNGNHYFVSDFELIPSAEDKAI